MAEDIVYNDCNVSIGRPRAGVYAPCPTAEALIAELDWHGVAGALVQRGYKEPDVAKVIGGNWLRVFKQVWGE